VRRYFLLTMKDTKDERKKIKVVKKKYLSINSFVTAAVSLLLVIE